MKRALFGGVCLGAALGISCLPGDVRPEPGRVYVTAESSAASRNGFTSDDGWTIHFDELLVGLGFTVISGESCNAYGNAQYDRLFDFTVAGAQKLGEMYGLGDCDIQFHLRPPSSVAYLAKGVTVDDRKFMRKSEKLWFELPTRTAFYVRGNAVRGSVTKNFDWKFIARYTLTGCTNANDETINTSVKLKAGDDLRPAVVFHAEDLFRDDIDADAARSFTRLADADTNADGVITLEEIAEIPAPTMDMDMEMDGGVADAGDGDAGATTPDITVLQGWARFMRTRLLPRMFYFDGNRCRNMPWLSADGDVDSEFDFDF